MLRSDHGILEQYATHLVASSGAITEDDLVPILQHVHLQPAAFDFYGTIAGQSIPTLVSSEAVVVRKPEAAKALSIVCNGVKPLDNRRHYLLNLIHLLWSFLVWELPNKCDPLQTYCSIALSVLQALEAKADSDVERLMVLLLERQSALLVVGAAESDKLSSVFLCVLNAKRPCWSSASELQIAAMLKQLLNSQPFDLRRFLADIPDGDAVDHVLTRHFSLVPKGIGLLRVFSRETQTKGADPDFLASHLQAVLSFLALAKSAEPTLGQILTDLLNLAVLGDARLELASVTSCVKDPRSYARLENYAFVLEAFCDPHLAPLFRSLKDALLRLPSDDALQGGSMDRLAFLLGELTGSTISHCLHRHHGAEVELVLKELLSSIPDSAGSFPSCLNALAALCANANDDGITHACLSVLASRFGGEDASRDKRHLFYRQLNLFGGRTNRQALDTVVDLYVSLYNANPNSDVGISFCELAALARGSQLKLEYLLLTLFRLFVSTALSHVKQSKSSKKAIAVGFALNPLESLLPAIAELCTSVAFDRIANKSFMVGLFQEFWFAAVFHGYQLELKWPLTWLTHISIIAQYSPALITERERLQTNSSMSQILLLKEANASIKSHVLSLMSRSRTSSVARNLSLGQCLWLLSMYQCELLKVEQNRFDTFLEYMTNDVVHDLSLYPLVEDLLMRIVESWLASQNPVSHQPCNSIGLLRSSLKYIGHVFREVHHAALGIFQTIDDAELPGVAFSFVLWDDILAKLAMLYEVKLAAANFKDPRAARLDVYTRDPTYASDAFDDFQSLATKFFGRVSKLYPQSLAYFLVKGLERHGPREAGSLIHHELVRRVIPDDFYENVLLHVSTSRSSVTCGPETITEGVKQLFDSLSIPDAKAGVASWFHCLHKDAPDVILVSIVASVKRAWIAHSKAGRGFYQDIPANPFRVKLASTPSKPSRTEASAELVSFYTTLIDGLHELVRAFVTEKRFAFSFYDLVRSLVLLMERLGMWPYARSVWISCLVLAWSFLTSPLCLSLQDMLIDQLRSLLYRSLIRFMERPARYSEDTSDGYTGSLASLITYLEAEGGIYTEEPREGRRLEVFVHPASLPSSRIPSSNASILLERPSIRSAFSPVSRLATIDDDGEAKSGAALDGSRQVNAVRKALLTMLRDELHRAQVWLSTARVKMFAPQADVIARDLATCLKTTTLLAVRFQERFHWCTLLDKRYGLQFARTPFLLLADKSLGDYLVTHEIALPDKAVVFAPPLSPQVAISIFTLDAFRSHTVYLNWAIRSLSSYPASLLYFYVPQIVQALRNEPPKFIQDTILSITSVSALFAHQVIWNMKANMFVDDAATISSALRPRLGELVGRIEGGFSAEQQAFYAREFAFFAQITSISAVLKPHTRKERLFKKQLIDVELSKVQVDPGVYLPSNPESIVVDIDYSSGRPLQSAAKAPFMATFRVKSESESLPVRQSAIFKVGDDCRQDVLALQIIAVCKEAFSQADLPLYVFPYRVVATAAGCGIIEAIPNSISRDQLGREKINNLYEYFIFKFGVECGNKFQEARINFIKSMAAYSVITYLLAIKDRHNGNIMIDDAGHIIHIDFGFILDIAPGGITFESAPFKLTSEMVQVMGGKESRYFAWFRALCVRAYLVLRTHVFGIVQLVVEMSQSGLPCFKNASASIDHLRERFRLDLNDSEATLFMLDQVRRSCENARTVMYDSYQYRTNGIPY